MNPTPPDAGSPLATLRQLKEMLDAGAITQQEFDTLKQRLIFGADPAGATGGTASPPAAAPLLPTPPYSAPTAPVTPASPAPQASLEAAAPPTPYLDTPAALTPEAAPLLTPEPDWLAAPGPTLLGPDHDEQPAFAEAAERRNPLNLIFALGGLLLFLAVVAYLVYDRRPDEHMTSQSQTAADSAAVAPEVGPQAEQLTLPPITGPDTVRVAPAVPTPTATAPPATDSATVPTATSPARLPAQTTTPAAKQSATPPKTAAPAAADTLRSPQPDGR